MPKIIPSDVKMTAEQQLDVLWALLSEPNILSGVTANGDLLITYADHALDDFYVDGTREQIIEQLCARQVANKLAG